MAKKKKISKTEKKLRGQIKYAHSKVNRIKKEFEEYAGMNENKQIKFEGKKRKIKTVKNILQNRAIQVLSKYKKQIERAKNQFGYVYNARKVKTKEPEKKKGVFRSPLLPAWENSKLKQLLILKAEKSKNLFSFLSKLDELAFNAASNNLLGFSYDPKNDFFDSYLTN